jgi:hypothetical protein
MTERKTDILNLRLDPSLAREIDRIAEWRGKSASEVARDLLHYGIAAERDLEAEELKRPFGSSSINRSADNVHVVVEARFRFYTVAELAAIETQIEEGNVIERRYEP